MWFKEPDFLYRPPKPETHEHFELLEPETAVDVRPQVTVLATHIEANPLTSERFKRFSAWNSLLRAVCFLIHQVRSHKSSSISDTSQHACKAWHQCSRPHTPEELAAARRLIIETVQRDSFPGERAALQAKREIPNSSLLPTLDPYISDGLLRVGGRLRYSSLESEVKPPIILSKNSNVTKLLVEHPHIQVKHTGRQFRGDHQSGWTVDCRWQKAGQLYPPSLCDMPYA